MKSYRNEQFTKLVELLIACGLVITINGYESRVVDQCYRLPILERMIDPQAFPADQFVQAFDKFNPHLGYLRILQFSSSLFGLSISLFLLYCITAFLNIYSVWRIRELVFPDLPEWTNWLLLLLLVLCKAGNLGTNHIWEDHLLDRQIAFALGWFALACWLEANESIYWKIPVITGLIAIIHPGLGLLNLALWCGLFSWNFIFAAFPREKVLFFFGVFLLSMLPWARLYLGQSSVLKAGVSPDLFWQLATEIQGPQHMRPSLWRSSQWYAAFSLLALGFIQFFWMIPEKVPQKVHQRASQWILMIVFGLFVSWPAIEYFHDINITLAQPWRLATPLRGLLLIILTSILTPYFSINNRLIRGFAFSIIVGLRNDWVTFFLCSVSIFVITLPNFMRLVRSNIMQLIFQLLIGGSLIYSLWWISAHDPQDGISLIAGSYLFVFIVDYLLKKHEVKIDPENNTIHFPYSLQISRRNAIIAAWLLPLSSLIIGGFDPTGQTRITQILASKWRIYETPRTDAEKMGVWLNANLPKNAMILTPPRDKSLRAWSHRSIVANVAGSPYQAAELQKWAERMKILSGFNGEMSEFANQWPTKRVEFETYYDKADANEIIGWAEDFKANYIIAPSHANSQPFAAKGWVIIHRHGRLIAYSKEKNNASDKIH